MSLTDRLGVVTIGRNEGERLRRCLASVVDRAACVVYVDSGSTDGSVEMARGMGVEVVDLDLSKPFTAARARNEGYRRLREVAPDVDLVQFVDGDCELVDGWLDAAAGVIDGDEKLAVVCGRRRERSPDASAYNRLCDLEWDTPIGKAHACGGDAMIRTASFDEVEGYDPTLIAGEEPEMCLRMRRRGWTIERIDHEMTAHDAQMTTFGQWWKRCMRCGYAYAEGHARYGREPERYHVDEIRSIVEWAAVLPLLAFGLAWVTWGASLILLGGYAVLWHRVRTHRLDRGDPGDHATLYARYCVMGKFAELSGAVRYWVNRLAGREGRIIEYKGPADGAALRTGS